MKTPINAYGLISCLGSGKEAHRPIFNSGKSGLTPEKLLNNQETYTGKITSELESIRLTEAVTINYYLLPFNKFSKKQPWP